MSRIIICGHSLILIAPNNRATVAGAGSVWACSQADPSRGVNFIAHTEPWITAFCSSTLSTNLICTCTPSCRGPKFRSLISLIVLLAFRIWQINSRVRCNGGSTLMPVVLIIIDAGLLYSASLLSGLVCFVAHSNGTWVVLDMVRTCFSSLFLPLTLNNLTSPYYWY